MVMIAAKKSVWFLEGVLLCALAHAAQAAERLPSGWEGAAQREEIRPSFSYDPATGPQRKGALVIVADDSPAQHGYLQKTFPVEGGRHVRFEVFRKTSRVDNPRRSAPVRIVWQDEQGKAVRADPPAGREDEAGSLPIAEPEHPLDGTTDKDGWTQTAGVYRVPSKATKAVVELHLQWAARGRVEWSAVSLTEVPAPKSRQVRLAAVHYTPSGKSPRANCEEYAPLIAAAAKQKADLVVLGETVPYVRTGKKPHETAEPIPGPTTDYFGELAKEHRLHVVVSLYEREGKGVYNAAVLLGPDGKLIGKYRKVCLPHSEIEAGVMPGSEYPVFDTQLGKIGLMICYDGFFPEVARELTNRGAEVIAWPVWGCNPLLAQARACENHVYLVSSTYTDVKSNWTLSAVYDHAGTPLAKAEKWGDVVVQEVDLNQRYFWRNNLGDFRAMVQRHRPGSSEVLPTSRAPGAALEDAKQGRGTP
jgi:predicted amidohydrolase